MTGRIHGAARPDPRRSLSGYRLPLALKCNATNSSPPGKHKRSGSATCYRTYNLPMDYMKLCASASSTFFRAPTKQANFVASRLDVLPAPGWLHHLPTICLNSCIDEGLLNTLRTSLGPHRCWLEARNRLNLGTLNRPGQRARRRPDTHTQHSMQTP